MKQSEKMNQALKKYVIQPLLENGFTGNFPHYRKVYENRIELFTIQKNKWGKSFTIEVSTIYPQYKYPKSNYLLCEDDNDEINVWSTDNRFRLKGIFNGWFYYTDVYKKHIIFFGNDYIAVSEDNKEKIPKGYKLVQQANDELYEEICIIVNHQMKKAYKWWKKHKSV